jgi:hypothetical protein
VPHDRRRERLSRGIGESGRHRVNLCLDCVAARERCWRLRFYVPTGLIVAVLVTLIVAVIRVEFK